MSTESWVLDEEKTLSEAKIAGLRRMIESDSPVIVEHRFYRGGRSPHRFVCEDGDALDEYLRVEVLPGDSLYFWAFDACCTDARTAAVGKKPDKDGRIPVGGAY